MDCGALHLRGIVLGPISVFWEEWGGEEEEEIKKTVVST